MNNECDFEADESRLIVSCLLIILGGVFSALLVGAWLLS